MGNAFPGIPPPLDARLGTPTNPIWSIHFDWLTYALFNWLTQKVFIQKCWNKKPKKATTCKTLRAVDPAKHDTKWLRIERAMLNFRPRGRRALPAHRAD